MSLTLSGTAYSMNQASVIIDLLSQVTASRKQQLPGKDVTVNVKSKPNSFVGILAVDTRVSRLNRMHKGNDITMQTVVNELRTYDSAQDPDFYPWFKVSAF